MDNKKLKVIELFAWVGGFRIWLENTGKYEVIWSNQWEPSTTTQHASMVYEARFWKQNHSNQDITTVNVEDIPDCDMLVWGFPCQDYSVASSLKNSKWLIWKKWVLWWAIHKILDLKKKKPKYLFLENVDRLLKSPVKQRGRDFAVMLKSLDDLGYAVEWRVINAADYGMPQRRRRIFILWYHKSTDIYKKIKKSKKIDWIWDKSIISQTFPIELTNLQKHKFEISWNLVEVSEEFNIGWKDSLFQNTGVFIDWKVYTIKTLPIYDWSHAVLWDILEVWDVDESFLISQDSLEKWVYQKWAKKEERITADGFKYNYSEWWMIFPDSLDSPSRTIITWEGWISPSRFKHVVEASQWLRRLTPLELERLNMFPDHHTKLDWVSDTKRAFFMWNALVVWVVEKIGSQLFHNIIHKS